MTGPDHSPETGPQSSAESPKTRPVPAVAATSGQAIVGTATASGAASPAVSGPVPHVSAPLPADPGPHSGDHRKPRRRWLTWLRVIALVIVLPVLALLVGLLIAWIVHLIRGNPAAHQAVTGPLTSASASAAPSAKTSAPAKAPVVVVPADWVLETAPPVGVTYRHPVGWIRRTSSPEVLRFVPASPGSTAPGIEGVGAGIETAATPAQAVSNFATRVYGGQPGYAVVTVAGAVPATAAGARHGEAQEVIVYRRSGIEVRVVIHSFTSGAKTVLVLGRSANAQPARAAQLESLVEASVKVS